MTTDTVPKIAEASVGAARIVGVAKGVGMIEPNMATMITMLFTDADVGADDLEPIFRRVIDHNFNCVSIDTDTSTSDTAIVMASGAAGPVDLDAFERGLYEVAASLTKQVARDGEGAEKLIEVDGRTSALAEQAKASRQGDRQLAARQDCGARRRSELGSGGDGDRQVDHGGRGRSVQGDHPLRRSRGVPVARSTTPVSMRWQRTCAATRCASRPRSPPAMRRPRSGAAI